MAMWSARGAVVLAAAAAWAVLLQGPAHASCVPHAITVEPSSAAAGSVVTVRGEAWFVGCNDTGQGTAEPPDTAKLSVEQNGNVFELGSATADAEYRFTIEVRLPTTLTTGPATIIGQGKGGQAQAPMTVTPEAELPQTGGGAAGAAAALAALGLLFVLMRAAQTFHRPQESFRG